MGWPGARCIQQQAALLPPAGTWAAGAGAAGIKTPLPEGIGWAGEGTNCCCCC